MVNEIRAIFWKEWREFFFQQSIKDKLQTILLIIVLGVVLPVNKGRDWFNTPFFYSVAVMGPILMATTVICDLFVGERERHTLETLLASKLSDKGIVLGKLLFAVSYATSITILLLVLNVIAINVQYYKGTFLVFSVKSVFILAFINFFLAFFTALIGVIISMGAKTVKQGQLMLTISFIAIILISSMLMNQLPDSFKITFFNYYNSVSYVALFMVSGPILLSIYWLMLKYTFYRFKKIS